MSLGLTHAPTEPLCAPWHGDPFAREPVCTEARYTARELHRALYTQAPFARRDPFTLRARAESNSPFRA